MKGALPFLLLLSVLPLSFAGDLWSYRTDGGVSARPIVLGGNVLAGTGNGAVYALSNGQARWTQRLDGGVVGVAAFGENAAFATKNKVYLVGPSGSILWTKDVAGIRGIAASDKVYVSHEGGIIALDERGSQSWFYNASLPTEANAAVAGYVVFGSGTKVIALRADGQKFWEKEVGQVWNVAPLAWSGTVFAGTVEGTVYALNLYSGEALWSYRGGDAITSTPANAGAYIILGTANGNVYAVSNGELAWAAKVDGMVNGKIAVDGGVAYLSTRKGLYALSVSDGSLLMRRQFVDWPSSPVVAGAGVAVGTADGRVYSIDASRGCGFLYPEPDALVGDADLEVTGRSFSKYGGASTHLRVNEGPWIDAGAEEWDYTLDPSQFPFGIITMECYVSDSAGQEAAPFSSIVLIKGDAEKPVMRVRYPTSAKEGEPFTIEAVGMDGQPLSGVYATIGGQRFEGDGRITITPQVSGMMEVRVGKKGYEEERFNVDVKPQPTLAYIMAAAFIAAAAAYAYFGYIKK